MTIGNLFIKSVRRARCPEVYWTITLGQRNSIVHLDERGWEILFPNKSV